ncbi:cytochrome P450 [Tahibacter aquaticus]|uniref:Cytochrome P450 n=1 Tax=Tahibacter aquaticus TaxID=520092 RepID=A0A4R6Z6G8_9GAMM|nr:cytochrome P450 [Tahibacter aquaticus]TDR47358.1 cytochrome P450 [Tahibacter aquaticus]
MNTPLLAETKPLATGPFGLPLLSFIQRDPLGAASHFQRELGDVANLRILFRRVCYLFNPEAARELLVDHADDLCKEKRLLKMFQTFQGSNVLTTEGAVWERQRRIVTPGFSAKRLLGYMELMSAAIDACIAAELPSVEGDTAEIDVDALTTRITMDVILRTLFSHVTTREEAADTSVAIRALSKQSMREAYWPFVARRWLPFPGRAEKQKHLSKIDTLIDRHINARLNAEQPHELKQDILDMLLAARDDQASSGNATLTSQEVRANCHVLFGAGFDTAASALTWWIGLMAMHPEVVSRLRMELETAGSDSTIETIARLPFLNATLKETMRLYPPSTALITRVAQRNLQVAGILIPKRTLVAIPIWHLHHDSRWFPEPMVFRPERFLPGAPGFPRGAYMPFGAGPHVCLGQHFASIEMALIAARLIAEFDFEFADGQSLPQPYVDLVLKPKTRIRVRFQRRRASPTLQARTRPR